MRWPERCEPAAGEIERHGRVAIALQAPDLARRSVLANVIAALGWWGVPRSERPQRARQRPGGDVGRAPGSAPGA